MSGSEDKYVYIWSTYHDLSKFTSVRRDRNDFWEGIKGNDGIKMNHILRAAAVKQIKIFQELFVLAVK